MQKTNLTNKMKKHRSQSSRDLRLSSILEEVSNNEEEMKGERPGYHQVYARSWVEVSGLSDVDEDDKENINLLNNDHVLCQ